MNVQDAFLSEGTRRQVMQVVACLQRSGALVVWCRWDSDEKKMAFTLAALYAPDPFRNTTELNRDVVSAIEWQASKTDAEIYQFREALLAGCEAAGAGMWENGVCDAWFADCREEIQLVLRIFSCVCLCELFVCRR